MTKFSKVEFHRVIPDDDDQAVTPIETTDSYDLLEGMEHIPFPVEAHPADTSYGRIMENGTLARNTQEAARGEFPLASVQVGESLPFNEADSQRRKYVT